jgi:UDPglucose--hexose-1-phosphate uridylyltransferase
MRPGGGDRDTPGWLVRAVPNKFPLLAGDAGEPDPPVDAPRGPADPAGLADPLASGRGDPDLFTAAPARGAHEVIVHAPAHAGSMADLGAEQLSRALDGWRERSAARAGAACVHLMVNEGKAAGASLEHSHAQLYALDFVPALIARERERFTAHNTRTMGGCLLCDLLQEEVRRRERVVAVDDGAVLLAPYASRSPYELQVVPRRHEPRFADAAEPCAALLGEALTRLRAALGGMPPFNLWVRTAPRGAEHFHWHIDLVPRITRLAGFELGTGIGINIRPPEQVAAELRGL